MVAMSSPTARTLDYLRSRGATAQVVEHMIRIPPRNGQPGRVFKRDLFGFIDIVALEPGSEGVLGVQTTDASNLGHRLEKIREEPRARLWISHGNRIAIVTWAKRGARGQRKLWTPKITPVTLETLDQPAVAEDLEELPF
jgi:hypothetical protein